MSVTVNSLPTVTATVNSPCEGQALNFISTPSGMTSYNWTGPVNFSIQNPTITSSVTANSGLYTLMVTDANGCQNTATTNAVVNPLPVVSASVNNVCIGQPLNFAGLPNGMTSYNWTGPSTFTIQNPIIPASTLTDAGTYTLTVVDANGCQNSATTKALVNALPVVTASANTPCEGQPLNFTGTPNGMTNYNWTGPSNFTAQNPSVTQASVANSGTYTLSVTDVNGCSNTTTVTVTVNPLPQATITLQNAQGCSPLLTNFSFNNPAVTSFIWNFGDGSSNNTTTSPTHLYTQTGSYAVILIITDNNGCSSTVTDANAVTVFATPSASFSYQSVDGSVTGADVNFIDQSSSDVTNWNWNFGDGTGNLTSQNPTHTYATNSDSSFQTTLIVTNANGCTDTITNTIKIDEPLIYYVPNVFTPDGDAFNQHFYPVFTSGFDINSYSLLIFNRWGEILFESHDATIGWDGTYHGKISPDGVYIWSIEFKTEKNDQRIHETGNVTLIR